MKSNRYGNPTQDILCPKCQSSKYVGNIPDFICLNCGNKFQSYKSKKDNNLIFRKKNPDQNKENKKINSSRIFTSDCPTQCPRCESTKIEKKDKYILCKSCGHFDYCEKFEGV